MSKVYASYDGYGENYRKLLPMLNRDGLVENACRLGACPEGSAARIACLGREYLITRSGVCAADGQGADPALLSVLIFYAVSQGAGEPTGDFALLSRLTGMIDGHNALAGDMMTAPLLRAFDTGGKFAAAMARLGGTEQLGERAGKRVFRLRALPVITVQFIFYEADEEFPADVQIMYDRAAPRFLEFECLAVLTGAVTKALIRCARTECEPLPAGS